MDRQKRRQADRGVRIRATGYSPVHRHDLRQLNAGEAKVENQYKRVVPWEGNRAALQVMAEVFELRPYFEWRGMGFISQSALRLRDTYAAWDTERRSHPRGARDRSQGGAVRRSSQGRAEACQCKLFGNECTPERPVGALMVRPRVPARPTTTTNIARAA